MAEKKTTKKPAKKAEVKTAARGISSEVETKVPSSSSKCNDRLCPIHGDKKLKLRGRTFEGEVIRKLPGRVTIQLDRMIKLPKYERYEKRRTKIHARLPECMNDNVQIGYRIQIAETRPISKMIHFVVSKVIKKFVLGAKK